ncbi:MAG TPA: stage V sporulation protein G, partial [Gemmatales bacterium]|nr:stage V sporulation protein G [Gemmatales bacterium]
DRCPGCHCKNHLRARFCNQCGYRLMEDRAPRDDHGRAKLHADVAHPINASAREFIQSGIIQAFRDEQVKAQQPGYVCRYDELDAGEETVGLYESLVGTPISADSRTHPPPTPRDTPPPPRASYPPHVAAERPGFGSGVFE